MINTSRTKIAWWVYCWEERRSDLGKFHLTQKDFKTLCNHKVDMQAVGKAEGRPTCNRCLEIVKEKNLEIKTYNNAWKETGHSPVNAEVETIWW